MDDQTQQKLIKDLLRKTLIRESSQALARKKPQTTQQNPAAAANEAVRLKKWQANPTPPDKPAGKAIEFPTPLHMLAVLRPDLSCHPWQAELLLQLGGYLDTKDLNNKSEINPENPFKLCLPAANGSGKDMIIIAAFAVWFAMKGINNLFVCTSASYEQLKFQTEPHIRELCKAANDIFGTIFRSVEFYHVCTLTASEIKLFATDEAGRAEGYHPRAGGQMALCMNEAKTVPDEIFEAFRRCTGYSYWLEISSPAGKSGHFYKSSLDAVPYPLTPVLGKTYLRYITAYDCPHIPRSHIETVRKDMSEWWFNSSVLALFSDFGEGFVIDEEVWRKPKDVKAIGSDIGIGLDLAAGGDETACYVRRGNMIIDRFFFRQRDTTITADLVDRRLNAYKSIDYTFRADDGGVGQSIIDQIVAKGWHVIRTHNQAAANNKREFSNIAAEMYFHVRRLLENSLHKINDDDNVLRRQITSRRYDQRDGGKFKLEPKPAHKIRTGESPDRADAYVLCMYSCRESLPKQTGDGELATSPKSFEELEAFIQNHPLDYHDTRSTGRRRQRTSIVVSI